MPKSRIVLGTRGGKHLVSQSNKRAKKRVLKIALPRAPDWVKPVLCLNFNKHCFLHLEHCILIILLFISKTRRLFGSGSLQELSVLDCGSVFNIFVIFSHKMLFSRYCIHGVVNPLLNFFMKSFRFSGFSFRCDCKSCTNCQKPCSVCHKTPSLAAY